MRLLADLKPSKRAEKVREALERVSRKLEAPVSTSELVKRLADDLGTKETNAIATVLDREIKPTWPWAEKTGETFERYGRTMHRWQWLPAVKARKPKGSELIEAEVEERRAAQAAAEEDEWTVHPEPAEFLEDEDGTLLH